MPFRKTFKVPRSRVLEDRTKKNGFRNTVYTVRGDVYVGEWKDNQKHGKGVLLSKNNYKLYEGDWKNGSKSGYGVMSKILDDGTRVLDVEGTWVNGKPEGDVRKHYTVRTNDAQVKHEAYYEGNMMAGKRHGHGRMWYSNGSFYDGNWKADMRDGIGLFVEVNGNRYEGEWKTNKKHGYGQFFHLHTGQMQYGLWNHGMSISSVMKDIQFRQACDKPTPYPIPRNGLQNPDELYEQEFDRIVKEQEQELHIKKIAYRPSTTKTRNLSPWFYDECCNKVFPRKSKC